MSVLRPLLLLVMLGLSAGILGGFLGAVHPVFDTLSNFRLHLSVGLLALAALWSLKCSRIPAFVFALVAFGGVAAAVPGLPITSRAVMPSAGERTYSLFVMNLLWNNPEPARVEALIAANDPDIVMLTELSPVWTQMLARLAGRYPHAFHCAEWGHEPGSIILSRFPRLPGDGFCGPYGSLGLARFEIGGRAVALGVVHLRWPWPASGPRQIDVLVPELARIGPDALVAGDFNSATWTHSVGRFAEAGGLTVINGIGGSWGPSLTFAGRRWQWPPSLGLPIDNAMAKGAVRVVTARTLEPAGSDHLPLLVNFVIRG